MNTSEEGRGELLTFAAIHIMAEDNEALSVLKAHLVVESLI
jgi:hypothetical protein